MSERKDKAGLINDMASSIVDIVSSGNNHPAKKDVLGEVVKRSMSPGASIAAISSFTDGMGQSIEVYWGDACRRASEMMDHRHYHLTSSEFYAEGCKKPTTLVDAMKYVVCFGNGRRGKSAGVRFVSADDQPDAMYLYATQKQVEVVNAALETQRIKTAHMISSPAIGNEERVKLGGFVLQVAA
jgi:hypothetical protein